MSARKSHGPTDAKATGTTASVSVLNWNGERFLDACMRSLRDHTLPSIERILVDNGLTDGSLALVTGLLFFAIGLITR